MRASWRFFLAFIHRQQQNLRQQRRHDPLELDGFAQLRGSLEGDLRCNGGDDRPTIHARSHATAPRAPINRQHSAATSCSCYGSRRTLKCRESASAIPAICSASSSSSLAAARPWPHCARVVSRYIGTLDAVCECCTGGRATALCKQRVAEIALRDDREDLHPHGVGERVHRDRQRLGAAKYPPQAAPAVLVRSAPPPGSHGHRTAARSARLWRSAQLLAPGRRAAAPPRLGWAASDGSKPTSLWRARSLPHARTQHRHRRNRQLRVDTARAAHRLQATLESDRCWC